MLWCGGFLGSGGFLRRSLLWRRGGLLRSGFLRRLLRGTAFLRITHIEHHVRLSPRHIQLDLRGCLRGCPWAQIIRWPSLRIRLCLGYDRGNIRGKVFGEPTTGFRRGDPGSGPPGRAARGGGLADAAGFVRVGEVGEGGDIAAAAFGDLFGGDGARSGGDPANGSPSAGGGGGRWRFVFWCIFYPGGEGVAGFRLGGILGAFGTLGALGAANRPGRAVRPVGRETLG